MTKEEEIKDLERQIAELDAKAKEYHNLEQCIKLTLNSIYGAFGNSYCYFHNVDIAQCITAQGKDAILYTEKLINKYFHEAWHKDKKAHTEMGIVVNKPCSKDVSVYIDTDSIYMEFSEVIKNCSGWEGNEKEFVMKLYQVRLKGYIERILQNYANHFNAENFLVFELETISKSAIWLSKKKYIKDLIWHDPDLDYESGTHVESKGIEIIQSSTPVFARTHLQELATYLLLTDNINIKEFTNKLKSVKKLFKLANIDDISFSKRVNNYKQYIINDYDKFEFGLKTPPGVKAAGYHNYLLNNSKYREKYNLIGNGEKLKIYYSKDPYCEVFAYSPGDYPSEIAPEMDYDTQFEKTILDPINRFVKVMGYKEYDKNLLYTSSVF